MTSGGDPTSGWPTGDRNPYLVEGEIQQIGKLAAGLKHNRGGRARAFRWLLWFALAFGSFLTGALLWSTFGPR